MPAPTVVHLGSFSTISHAIPRCDNAAPSDRPPIPPPTIRTFTAWESGTTPPTGGGAPGGARGGAVLQRDQPNSVLRRGSRSPRPDRRRRGRGVPAVRPGHLLTRGLVGGGQAGRGA